MDSAKTGIVFNIQRYTIHDGPGIRTEVFLKGCTMHCKWCSNPESINHKREVGVYPAKCLGKDVCGSCLEVCSLGGAPLLFNPQTGKVGAIDRSICIGCMKCTDECFLHALKSWGMPMTVDEVMAEVRADRNFYANSGGGLTISGGEVGVQWEFAVEVLKATQAEGIHTCTETSMMCSREALEALIAHSDMLITDIKTMDPEAHRHWCGSDNGHILSNIEFAVESGVPLIIRIPVIPGVNDSEENIRATSEFIVERLDNRVAQVQLLAYMKMGAEKYESLGLDYPMPEDWNPAERAERDPWIRQLAQMMRDEYGIKAYEGATTQIEGYDYDLYHHEG